MIVEAEAGHLDDEALRAFKAAGPFPNPPPGLFGDRETFTFHFGFAVEFDQGLSMDMNWRPY